MLNNGLYYAIVGSINRLIKIKNCVIYYKKLGKNRNRSIQINNLKGNLVYKLNIIYQNIIIHHFYIGCVCLCLTAPGE